MINQCLHCKKIKIKDGVLPSSGDMKDLESGNDLAISGGTCLECAKEEYGENEGYEEIIDKITEDPNTEWLGVGEIQNRLAETEGSESGISKR